MHVSTAISNELTLTAGNGEIVPVGEAYDTQAAAMEGCAAVQRAAEGATVVEAGS